MERLAREAGLEIEALQLFEAGDGELAASDVQRLAAALRQAGVVLLPAALAGEGVRFRSPSVTAIQDHQQPSANEDFSGDWE